MGHVHTNNPFPAPPPARAVRPRPSRLGARVGPSDSSLPPPAPGGGLNTMLTRSAKIPIPTPSPARELAAPSRSPRGLDYPAIPLRQNPNPHPSPRSRPSAHAPRFRFGAWSSGRLAAPPRSRGGLLITSSPTIQHIYCVSAPLHGRLFAFSLATVRPLPRCASAWNGRTLTKRFSGYAYPEKRP